MSNSQSKWLDIIGVTEAGLDALPPEQKAVLGTGEAIIGPERLIAMLGDDSRGIIWTTPLATMLDQVLARRGMPTIILASGDPNWFGIGATLTRHLDADEFSLHPAPSAFQLAAARLYWPLQNAATISLHGRPVASLHPHISPGNRILALTSDAGILDQAAALLNARGYAQSLLTVLENLGGPNERRIQFRAADPMPPVGDFYVLAIDCVADQGAPLLPPVPGLPDTTFVSDGQLTKREVRAATIAKLAPFPGALLWDVGAGAGSIAIEWMRAAATAKAICFERDLARCDIIAENRTALGVPGLQIIAGDAAQGLVGQPAPDAVFLGGDVSNEALFNACWQALKPGGRLVANAVTVDGEQALYRRQAEWGGELTRIEISVLDTIGAERVMRPRMAVTQWLARKGYGA